MNRNSGIGKTGEQIAADYLKNSGYVIFDMNYSCRFGEIDIIAADNQFVIFAEVKTRNHNSYAKGREYVTAGKQKKIVTTAMFWLQGHKNIDLQPRFDVVEIQYSQNDGSFNVEGIEHIPDAFC